MATTNWFTVSSYEEFNTRLWNQTVKTRLYKYAPTKSTARKGRPAEAGEPPGKNDDMKNLHLLWIQHFWDWEDWQAAQEDRQPNYSLIYEPPAADSGKEELANNAKLLAFYRWLLDSFDSVDGPLVGINIQIDRCSVGFFGHLLAAQFADCPKRLQEYKMLSVQDRDDLQCLARRITAKLSERKRDRDAFDETIGAALTSQDILRYLNMTWQHTGRRTKGSMLSVKAIIAHMFANANRGVREVRLRLSNLVGEELDVTAKTELSGACTEGRMLVHGFTVQAGGAGAQDKVRGKTARWELDGFLRHANLELCAASKIADYLLLRFKDLPLEAALGSPEDLVAFMDERFFMRHFKKKKRPDPYTEETLKNVLAGTKKSPGLEKRVGLRHIPGKMMHRIKHGAIKTHIDTLGNTDAARRLAKHAGKVHEVSYSNRTWCPKLDMAKVAGHRGGLMQLYRAGIWASKDAAHKPLFDRITPVTDALVEDVRVLLQGHPREAGVLASLEAVRNYTDVILQDLVELVRHPAMGPDYLAATDRFPFLAARDVQHDAWLRFCRASEAKAAAMRAADGAATFQPQTPPPLPPVLQPVQEMVPLAKLLPAEQPQPVPAATINIFSIVPDALTAPGSPPKWTCDNLWNLFVEPLKEGLPPLREIIKHQVNYSPHSFCWHQRFKGVL